MHYNKLSFKQGLSLLAWQARRRLAMGRPAQFALKRLILELEAVGEGKFGEVNWIEYEIRKKLEEGYCVFLVDTMGPGDYSSVRHLQDDGSYDVSKSVKYVKERYPDAMVCNDDPGTFIKHVQKTGAKHFLFEKNPASIVETMKRPRRKKSPAVTEDP